MKVVATAVFSMLASQSSGAAQLSADVPVPLVPQDTIEWCWVAAAEMILQYKNVDPPSQCRIMEIGYRMPEGSCCGNTQNCTIPGTTTQIQRIIHDFGGGYSAMGRPANPTELYNLLSKDIPIIAHLRLATGGHFVVIRGIEGDAMNPMITINDPMQSEPFQLPFFQLAQVWDTGIYVEAGETMQPPNDQAQDESEITVSENREGEQADSCKTLRKIVSGGPSYVDSLKNSLLSDDEDGKEWASAIMLDGAKSCTISEFKKSSGTILHSIDCYWPETTQFSKASDKFEEKETYLSDCISGIEDVADDQTKDGGYILKSFANQNARETFKHKDSSYEAETSMRYRFSTKLFKVGISISVQSE